MRTVLSGRLRTRRVLDLLGRRVDVLGRRRAAWVRRLMLGRWGVLVGGREIQPGGELRRLVLRRRSCSSLAGSW